MPSDSAVVSDFEELDLAALARLAGVDLGLEPLEVEPVGVGVRLPVLEQRVDHVLGPREERLALAPVRAHVVEVGRASSRPSSPVRRSFST